MRARAVLLHHRAQVHAGGRNVQLLLVLVVALGEAEEANLGPQVLQRRFGKKLLVPLLEFLE
eukprot:6235108-Pyramimonas_sp.AAC.1